MEAVIRFNHNPNLNYQKDAIVLLDPTDNSSENGEILINENESVFESYSDFGEMGSEEIESEETDSEKQIV